MESVLGRGDIGNLTDDSSGDEVIDNGEQELEVEEQLPISAAEVERNYALMGVLCEPEEPAQSLEQLRQEYPQAFSDISEKALSDTLEELNLPFALSPFQVGFHMYVSVQFHMLLLTKGVLGECLAQQL